MSQTARIRPNALAVALADSRPLLACYLPVGDPLMGDHILDAYVDGGVNIIELGMPTHEPRLDGPDVADSMARAFTAGIDLPGRFRQVSRELRSRAPTIGSVCMTYEDSPILAGSSLDTFESVDATLILSSGQGASDTHLPAGIRDAGVRSVVFVPARFTSQDIEAAKACDSYVMLQATEGVTGPRPGLDCANADKIGRLRAAGVTAPILLGFGISTTEQAKSAIQFGADGVVIGSMCLRKARKGKSAIRAFVRDVRAAIDA